MKAVVVVALAVRLLLGAAQSVRIVDQNEGEMLLPFGSGDR